MKQVFHKDDTSHSFQLQHVLQSRYNQPVKSRRVWLLFLYQLPSRPSTQRVYVWRRLKGYGALYLQNSVCLLPAQADLLDQIQKLTTEIEARQGEARLLRIHLADATEEERVIGLFRAQVDEEHGEFMGKCKDFHGELTRERAASHFTFAELDENAHELDKLHSWLPKIHRRDFFHASLAQEATAALSECERDFDAFANEVEKSAGKQTNAVRLTASTDEP
jgi:hypothetical protein